MWIVESSKYCRSCQKHFELDEMKLGRVQIKGGERIFFTCPVCGEEIENKLVNRAYNWYNNNKGGQQMAPENQTERRR